MTDQYAAWRAALAGETVAIHDAEPNSGFYRVKRKNQELHPVAIWRDEAGTVFAQLNGESVEPALVWPWAAKKPVTYEAYQAFMDGKGWPDDAPVVPISEAPPTSPALGDGPAENPRAVPAHNSGDADAAEAMRLELLGEKELADQFLAKPITSQEAADQVAVWSKRISDLKNRADKAFQAEKAPHLEAGRLVDEKWRWRQDAEALVRKLKNHVTPWLEKLRADEQERARKAAEEARRQQEEAARLAAEAQAGDEAAAAQAEEAQARAVETAKAAEVQRTGAGRTGAKVSLRTVTEVIITDPIALATFYAGMQELNPDLKEVLLKLARRNISSGVTPPGVSVTTKQVAA